MTDGGHMPHDAELAERLRERGQRVTSQRVVIARALRELDRHVSAEEVLGAVRDRLPNMSLPTVYATLELLRELGVVRRVSVTGAPALYDPRADDHEHFVCRRCGAVADLDASVDTAPALRAARRAGMAPDDAGVVVTGLCARCATCPRGCPPERTRPPLRAVRRRPIRAVMTIRRSSRAAACPRSAAARSRAAVRARTLPALAILVALAIQLVAFAAVAGAAVTGGVSVPSGAAGDRHGGDRGSASGRSGSGRGDSGSGSGSSSSGSARSHPTGGVGVPPPGARRGDDSKKDDPKKDEPKKDEGRKDDDARKDGKDEGRKDEGRSGGDDRKPPRADDDRPGPGAADIPSNYLELYRAAGAVSDVSWRLVAAVGKNESDHGRSKLPGVRSGVNSAGCCSGPMQICTVKACGNTWEAYKRDGNGDGVTSVYDAADAIYGAAALLGELQGIFGKHPGLILAGYNAGPGAVQRHKGVPPYHETQDYVKRGLDYMRTLGP